MYNFILGCLIGVFLGVGLTRCVDEHQLKIRDKEKTKVIFNYLLIYFIFALGLYLYLTNLQDFLQFQKVETLKDLQGIVFSTPVIQQLVVFAVYALLLSIISFIIRSPFFKLEQIKIFGFEAKAAIKEKAEQEAKEELDYMFLIENLRMDSIELFTSELTYDIIIQNLNLHEHVFNGKQALEEILESYSILYRESPLNSSIRYGVLTIHHNEISVADYEHYMRLPNYLKEDIDYVIKTKHTEKWNHMDIHTFVTPIAFLDDLEVYYIVYLSSYEIEFNSLTEKQFMILRNLIELYIKEHQKSNVLES